MATEPIVNFTTRMPASLVRKLDKLADREVSSRNRELIIAARAHIDRSERKNRK